MCYSYSLEEVPIPTGAIPTGAILTVPIPKCRNPSGKPKHNINAQLSIALPMA